MFFIYFYSATEGADSNPESEGEEEGKAGFASGKFLKYVLIYCFVRLCLYFSSNNSCIPMLQLFSAVT